MTAKTSTRSAVTTLHLLATLAAMGAPLVLGGCAMETDAGAPEDETTATESEELRRDDFGQHRSLAVWDQSNVYHGNLPLWSRSSTTFAPGIASGTFQSLGITSLERVSWVGDQNSYVDVFTNDLGTTATAGLFRRYRFPYASNQQRAFFTYPVGTTTFSPAAYSFELPAGTWRSMRVYDRGECSGEATYRDIGTGIVDGLTTKLDDSMREKGLGGASLRAPARVRPLLSASASGIATDRFEIDTKYRIATCSGDLDVVIQGSFGRASNRPTFTVRSVNAHMDFGDDFCAGWLTFGGSLAGKFDHWFNVAGLQTDIEDAVEAAIRGELGAAVGDAMTARIAADPGVTIPCRVGDSGDAACLAAVQLGLRSRGEDALADALTATNARCLPSTSATAGVCKVVPNVVRVNTRADGIELVLADSSTDPWVPRLSSAGVCRRDEPALQSAFSFGWPTPPEPTTSVFGTTTL